MSLSYLEEAYLLIRVPLWSRSERQKIINPTKIYTVDPAFKYVMTGESYKGRVLEIMVFMDIRRIGHEPCYWKEKQEVDFHEVGKYLLNVCLDIFNLDIRKREPKGLEEAMESTGLKQSTIVTLDHHEIIELEDGIVRAREFFLEIER